MHVSAEKGECSFRGDGEEVGEGGGGGEVERIFRFIFFSLWSIPIERDVTLRQHQRLETCVFGEGVVEGGDA